MINWNKVEINKDDLKYGDKVLCVDISEYDEHNQLVQPFIAIIKIGCDGELFFDCEEDKMLYNDDYNYIVIKVL